MTDLGYLPALDAALRAPTPWQGALMAHVLHSAPEAFVRDARVGGDFIMAAIAYADRAVPLPR